MATQSPQVEDYPILLRSGDAVISRLVLTGWGTAAGTLKTWSDRGRMWGTITTGDVFELYRRPGLASGDKVCNGTISSNAVTLAAANSSGISGSADIPSFTAGTAHLFDCIVSYADEQDIVSVYAGAADELDTNNKWEGLGTRFEELLKEQKRVLDAMIWARLKGTLGKTTTGMPRLGYLADPRQFARVHALLCVSHIYMTRGARDLGALTAATTNKRAALDEFNLIEPLIDTDRATNVESIARLSSVAIRRC